MTNTFVKIEFKSIKPTVTKLLFLNSIQSAPKIFILICTTFILISVSCEQPKLKEKGDDLYLFEFDSASMVVNGDTLFIDTTKIVARPRSPITGARVCICNCKASLFSSKELTIRQGDMGTCPSSGDDCRFKAADGTYIYGKIDGNCRALVTEIRPPTSVKPPVNTY
jgi:hypothetical protein